MTTAKIHVCIDIKGVQLGGLGRVEPVEYVDFAHQLMLTLNQTTAWRTCRLMVYLVAANFVVEVSPALNVTVSPREFRATLKDLFLGREVTAGGMTLLKIRKELPSLPQTIYALHRYAQKVVDPADVVGESITVFASLEEKEREGKPVCFSRYPLSPLNQMMGLIAALEHANDLE